MDKLVNIGMSVYVAFGILSGLGYLFFKQDFLKQKEQKVVNAKENIKAMNTQIKKIDKQIKDAESELQLDELGYSLDELKKYIPTVYTATQLISLLTKEAQESEANVISSRPISAVSQKSLDFVSVELELRLNYKNLVHFLARLTSVSKVIVLTSYSLSYKTVGESRLHFKGVFTLYYSKALYQSLKGEGKSL